MPGRPPAMVGGITMDHPENLAQANALEGVREARAVELSAKRLDWNEIDFVAWKEFQRMAPAVIRLETGRLERVMGRTEPGTDLYNTLVRARFGMKTFAEGLADAGPSSLVDRADHLRRALLAISLAGEDSETLSYVAQRLTYVLDRLPLVY